MTGIALPSSELRSGALLDAATGAPASGTAALPGPAPEPPGRRPALRPRVPTLVAVSRWAPYRCFPHCRSINDHETTVRFGKSRRQTPDRDAIDMAFFSSCFAIFVEKLPRQRATLFPGRAFDPGQQNLAL